MWRPVNLPVALIHFSTGNIIQNGPIFLVQETKQQTYVKAVNGGGGKMKPEGSLGYYSSVLSTCLMPISIDDGSNNQWIRKTCPGQCKEKQYKLDAGSLLLKQWSDGFSALRHSKEPQILTNSYRMFWLSVVCVVTGGPWRSLVPYRRKVFYSLFHRHMSYRIRILEL